MCLDFAFLTDTALFGCWDCLRLCLIAVALAEILACPGPEVVLAV